MADRVITKVERLGSSKVNFLRKSLWDIAAKPLDAPSGLSGQHYVDEEYFAYEKATVLQAGWHCVGRVDELPQKGDYRTLQLFDEPIILVNSENGVKALSNLCGHRGMPLAQGCGNTRLFVCPYHAWSYKISGDLIRAPRMENKGFDHKTFSLPNFPCVEKFGFIYVSLSDNPTDLDEDLRGLSDKLCAYNPSFYRLVYTADEAWKTNWKCLVENFMEGYHLSVVHPKTLHGYTPSELSKKGPSGPGFTSYIAHYPDHIPSRGQGSDKLTERERHASFLFATFPCQVVSIAPPLLVSLSLLPRSSQQVDVRWTMSVYGDELDTETINSRIALWTEVNREDREKLELMQQALGSRHARGGPLAGPDYEGTVRDFVWWLATRDKELYKEKADLEPNGR